MFCFWLGTAENTRQFANEAGVLLQTGELPMNTQNKKETRLVTLFHHHEIAQENGQKVSAAPASHAMGRFPLRRHHTQWAQKVTQNSIDKLRKIKLDETESPNTMCETCANEKLTQTLFFLQSTQFAQIWFIIEF